MLSPRKLWRALGVWALWICASVAASASATGPRAYIQQVPPETLLKRMQRHEAVARRRAEPIVMVHRGATSFAPENTLEVYAAAMDYGADGCEVDVRRTREGVLVLFHDDMLDRLAGGFGTVSQLSYAELLWQGLRPATGRYAEAPIVPTFAALLAVARQRAMLLHLDVKETGLDEEVARLLDAADAWDHVVAVNTATAPRLAANPKLKPLAYKGPGLYEGRRDVDPEAVRAQLARPGQMIVVDDPRVAAQELKRPPYAPVALPARLLVAWTDEFVSKSIGRPDTSGSLIPMRYLQKVLARDHRPWLDATLQMLKVDSGAIQPRSGVSPADNRALAERILVRAWAANDVGTRKAKRPDFVRLLEDLVRHRSLHRDWMYHGLDGAMAALSLGELGARESAPVLVEAFLRVDPELRKVQSPEFRQNPLGWTDFRIKMYIIPALGQMRSRESKRFLQQYVSMSGAEARELAPLMFEDATRALLRQELSRREVVRLLRSAHSAVRGTAILECLDRPSPERTAALKAAAPWALEHPAARK